MFEFCTQQTTPFSPVAFMLTNIPNAMHRAIKAILQKQSPSGLWVYPYDGSTGVTGADEFKLDYRNKVYIFNRKKILFLVPLPVVVYRTECLCARLPELFHCKQLKRHPHMHRKSTIWVLYLFSCKRSIYEREYNEIQRYRIRK